MTKSLLKVIEVSLVKQKYQQANGKRNTSLSCFEETGEDFQQINMRDAVQQSSLYGVMETVVSPC